MSDTTTPQTTRCQCGHRYSQHAELGGRCCAPLPSPNKTCKCRAFVPAPSAPARAGEPTTEVVRTLLVEIVSLARLHNGNPTGVVEKLATALGLDVDANAAEVTLALLRETLVAWSCRREASEMMPVCAKWCGTCTASFTALRALAPATAEPTAVREALRYILIEEHGGQPMKRLAEAVGLGAEYNGPWVPLCDRIVDRIIPLSCGSGPVGQASEDGGEAATKLWGAVSKLPSVRIVNADNREFIDRNTVLQMLTDFAARLSAPPEGANNG